MKTFVIGCGRFGTFIAWYLDRIGHQVSLYGRETSKNMIALMEKHGNDYVDFSDTLKLTTNLDEIVDAETIVISINAQNVQSLCDTLKPYDLKYKTFVLC